MESRESIWGRRIFVVITGASRGLGRTIAIEFAKQVKKDSTILLLARSTTGLEETKAHILHTRSDINVEISSTDLSKPDKEQYSQIFINATKMIPYDLYLLVHNAGTIIIDTPAAGMDDIDKWNEFMSMNLYSAAIMTSVFMKLFGKGQICIVNISSIAAQMPMKGWGMYCSAKSGRESYFKVLALENPTVNVLNYSPGPIETDMYKQVLTHSCFPDTKENFRNMKMNKIEDTVHKLISLLKEQSYENGAFICYNPISDV